MKIINLCLCRSNIIVTSHCFKMPSKVKTTCLHGPTNTYILSSPIGELEITSCPKGLHSLSQQPGLNDNNFKPDSSIKVEVLSQLYQDNGYVYKPAIQCVEWLKDYFKRSNSVSLPLSCPSISKQGSFTEKVWKMLPELVPYGETISYGQLAAKCGNVNACRAVGHAMSSNPISLVMPCHRVIQSSGQLGNYNLGKKNFIKAWLLEHEGSIR